MRHLTRKSCSERRAEDECSRLQRGTDSTALLVGLYQHHISLELILFADPGAEQPHTYAFLDTMERWLVKYDMSPITRIWYIDQSGQRLILEQECLRSGSLPSIAYGYKKCSQEHKMQPREKFCRHHELCRTVWVRKERVVKFISYDAGEEDRRTKVADRDKADALYQKEYPLMEWGWNRERCICEMQDAGLPLPGKSSCFFCPSTKRWEIRTLYHQYPDLLERVLKLEENALPNLHIVRGLGRDFAWRDLIRADENQLAIPEVFPDESRPCSC